MTDQAELLPERKEPEGFRLRVLNRNDLKLEDYYYLEDLLKRRTPSPAQADRDRIGDFALKFIRETYGPCPESETPEEERWHARVGLLIDAISTYEDDKQ